MACDQFASQLIRQLNNRARPAGTPCSPTQRLAVAELGSGVGDHGGEPGGVDRPGDGRAPFGFCAAEALRDDGLTLLTSFSVHAGVFPLVGNLYFLLVFGDTVEDGLGRTRYGLLLEGATVSGHLAHGLGVPGA